MCAWQDFSATRSFDGLDCHRSRGGCISGRKPAACTELLLAYGWGKPPEFVPIEGADPLVGGVVVLLDAFVRFVLEGLGTPGEEVIRQLRAVVEERSAALK